MRNDLAETVKVINQMILYASIILIIFVTDCFKIVKNLLKDDEVAVDSF